MSFVPLEGAKNTRDFGGIVNKNGRCIKGHQFVRSCALDRLTKKDMRILTEEYRLNTIIDLRDDDEVKEKPDRKVRGSTYLRMPVFTAATFGVTMEKKSIEFLENLPDFSQVYRNMVTQEGCVEHLKSIFEVILRKEPEDGAMLWHCSEGKDRCGLVSALFLALMDVDRETILKDYVATNDVPSKNKKRYYWLVRVVTNSKEKADSILYMFEANERFLGAALDAIDETYGSMDAFLENQLGISKEQKATFQEKYLK